MYGTQLLSEHDFRVCGVNFVQFAPFPPILKHRLDITDMADWAFKTNYLCDFKVNRLLLFLRCCFLPFMKLCGVSGSAGPLFVVLFKGH